MPERFNPRNHTGKTRKISGQWAFSNLCIILGWPVDPKKRKVTDSENELLGIHASLARFKHEDKIVFNPTEKRVREVLSDLRGYKTQGSLDPHEAASLQGRLSFTLSTAYASVGRAAIQPLIDRSSGNAPKVNTSKKNCAPRLELWPWTKSMSHMLAYYEALFPNLPPLVFDFLKRKRHKVVIYTDASCSTRHYGLGFIIIIDGQRFYLNTVAPPWLIHILKRVTQSLKIINQLELLAILCATC
jgi:hypothetical protein